MWNMFRSTNPANPWLPAQRNGNISQDAWMRCALPIRTSSSSLFRETNRQPAVVWRQAAGGCLAAGRGFFHINAYGGAEPCPFSAHSDCSLKNMSLKEAMHSPLFTKLRTSGVLEEPHVGSCTLFLQDAKVKALEKGENV